MKRKIIAILMMLIMTLSLVACEKSRKTSANVDEMTYDQLLEEAKGSTVTFYGWGGDEDFIPKSTSSSISNITDKK